MARIDFWISNNRHHVAMMLPIAEQLDAAGHTCRIVSLCELRGMETPASLLQHPCIPTYRMVPGRARAPSAGGQTSSATTRKRRLIRALVWHAYLAPGLRKLLRDRPACVVVPNDVSYPLREICAHLRRRKIPFVLVQEGLRVDRPSENAGADYGRSGAQAIAAWGPASRDFFAKQGVARERIHVTGNPRFDGFSAARAAAGKPDIDLPSKTLLFLSNPVDDQGFCTTAEKLHLFQQFLRHAMPVLEDPDVAIVVKLHARESLEDYRAMVLAQDGTDGRVMVLSEGSIPSLLSVSAAAVVMASTTGLEAMMFDVPLGVLALPRFGFIHDYVSSGAATGVLADETLPERLRSLLDRRGDGTSLARATVYVANQVDLREGAASRIAALIETQTHAD